MFASATKLFAIAAFALAAISGAHAAECTSDEVTALTSAAQLVYADPSCATITTDLTTATQDEVCESTCMDYLSTIISEFPDCEYSGTNLRTSLEALMELCGTDSSVTDSECTSDQVDQLTTALELLNSESSCSTFITDLSAGDKEAVCEGSCIDYLSTIASQFPDCSYGGSNLGSAVSALLKVCNVDAASGSSSSLRSSATALSFGYVSGLSVVLAVAFAARA